MQQMPDTEITDSKEEVSCLNWTIYISRRRAYVNYQTHTENGKNVVYRYRNSFYL